LGAIRQFGDNRWKWTALAGLWQTDIERRATIFAELAQCYDARFNSMFLLVPLPYSDDMVAILESASRSNDARLRRFTIEFISMVARSGPRPLPGVFVQYPIPEPLRPIVERAKLDSDPGVREAAAVVGLGPGPGGSALQGVMGS